MQKGKLRNYNGRGSKIGRMHDFTGAGFLGGEFINKNRDSESMDSLGGNEEAIVIVNHHTDKDEGGDGADKRQEHLHLGRLPPYPCPDHLDRPFGTLHRHRLSVSLSKI